MIKFVDATIFIERWSNENAKDFTDNLDKDKHCTSVLVLTEVFHKLSQKDVKNVFEYVRALMGSIVVYDITQQDFFNAIKSPLDIIIHDKIHYS